MFCGISGHLMADCHKFKAINKPKKGDGKQQKAGWKRKLEEPGKGKGSRCGKEGQRPIHRTLVA